MNVMSKFAFAITMAAAAASASAQEHAHGDHAHAAHAAPAAAAELSVVDGEVKKIDKETGKITVRHGEIANLNMAAMTMVFRTRDAAMLDAVKAGDKIKFSADRVNGAVTIVQLQKAL